MNLRREVVGGILNIVPAGTLVDVSGTPTPASATVKPTAASGLWDSMGRTLGVNFDKKTTTDPEITFNPENGKWEEDENEIVTADYIDMAVRDHNVLIWRMLFGIKGDIPTDGTTPVIPFETSTRHIYAWIQQQSRNADDNVNRSVFDIWVKMSIKNYPGWSEKAAKPELRFEKQYSALNTGLFMANL